MKRFLSVTLVAAMMLTALVGCGSQEESSSEGSVSDDVIELEFYQQKHELIGLFDELIAEFTAANPNIKIEQVCPPDSETALVSRLATNDVPDLLTVWPAEAMYQDMMAEGMLLDLTGNEFLDRTSPAVLEMSGHEGVPYTMPTTISSFGIFCNMGIFEANGLELPTTYDELIAVCEALKANGVQPFVCRDKETSRIRQEGDRFCGILNNDISSVFEKVGAGETSFANEPELRTLAEIMLELRKYAQEDTLGTGEEQALSTFFNGDAAMIVNGTWFMADIHKASPDGNYMMIPMPNKNEGPTKAPINVDIAYCVSSQSANQEAALKFIDFVTSDEVAQRFADKEGGLSCMNKVVSHTPELKILDEIISKNGDSFLTPSNYWPIGMANAWVGPLQGLVMTGDIDAFLADSDAMALDFYNR